MNARYLLGHARRDPSAVLTRGQAIIDGPDFNDLKVQAIVYRSMALAARVAGTAAESTEFANYSLTAAEAAQDERLTVESLMTLAGCLMFEGENQAAIDALERTDGKATGHLDAELKFQMGTVRARMGDSSSARRLFSQALPVFVEHDDHESVALTLHNRGMLNLYQGDLDQALDDFERAREIEVRLGMKSAEAAVEHNIGVATAFAGDLPKALEILDRSEAQHLAFAESPAEVQVSRVEVLLTAGLFHEALDLAQSVSTELEHLGLGEDQAEAILAAAEAARLAGQSKTAIGFAKRAADMFDEQSRISWRLNAEQVVLGARLDMGAVEPKDVATARRLASELEQAGLYEAAFSARLTAGLVALRCGLTDEASIDLRVVAARRGGPVQQRLNAALARTLVLELEGDPIGAEARARSGMTLLDDYQAVLGASDVRAGVEKHAAQLGELGVRLATTSHDPRLVLEWLEMTRARSLRHRPVRHEPDSPYTSDLKSLRQVQSSLRRASRPEARRLEKKKRQLEEAVRDRSRHAPGTGRSTQVSITDLLDKSKDTILIEYGAVDDELWRVTVRQNQVEARVVGSVAEVLNDVKWNRFDMRRLARGRGDTEKAIVSAGLLDATLFGGLEIDLPKVVIVPLPTMYAFSWSTLPTLSNVATTVAPSLATWADRVQSEVPPSASAVVITGPDLEHAKGEVAAVSQLYAGGMAAHGPATVDSVLVAMEGADVVHFACHATFVRESPMFSSLRLDDGDLHVHDLQQLERPPRLVVLSACDSGFSSTHPGEELLGLTSGLLAVGARSVVASVGLVPDSLATQQMMVEFHRGVLEGNSPAQALKRAQESIKSIPGGYVAAGSFICIGGG